MSGVRLAVRTRLVHSRDLGSTLRPRAIFNQWVPHCANSGGPGSQPRDWTPKQSPTGEI
jgi:hypothetical protein